VSGEDVTRQWADRRLKVMTGGCIGVVKRSRFAIADRAMKLQDIAMDNKTDFQSPGRHRRTQIQQTKES
jgi:hypothetical protein